MKKNTVIQYLTKYYDKEQILKIIAYVELIENWRKHTNIVGKNEQLWERHIADCIWIVPHIKKFVNPQTTIADIGTGAGLPGVVIAILLNKKVTLIEATEKKCRFLEKVKQLDIPIEILCSRIENVSNSYQILTARAVAPLDKLVTLARPIIEKNGVCCFQKGKNVHEEIKNTEKKYRITYQKKTSPLADGGCLLILRGVEIKNIAKTRKFHLPIPNKKKSMKIKP